jgi:hypothetical protein
VSVRFGQTGTITLVTFPILLTGSCEVLAVINPFGVCMHVSSFCNDYPDFTFLLFRLFGPAGPSLLVAFLASYISQWRVARLTPRAIIIFLFEVLTVLMIVVSLARYFASPRTFFVRTTVIYDADQFLRRQAFPAADLFVFASPFDGNVTDVLLGIANRSAAMIAFACSGNGSIILTVALPDQTVLYKKVTKFEKQATFIRVFLKDLLVVNSPLGRIGFVFGREMFKPEFFSAWDVDLLVTFGGSDFDEKCGLAARSSIMVSQMTGATRLHTSASGATFAVSSDGSYQFRDEDAQVESKHFQVKVPRNQWKGNGVRFLVVGYVIAIAFIGVVGLSLIPRKRMRSFLLRAPLGWQ